LCILYTVAFDYTSADPHNNDSSRTPSNNNKKVVAAVAAATAAAALQASTPSSTPPIRPSTSLPTRKKKKQHRHKLKSTMSTSKKANRISGLFLTEQELQSHVHDIYTNGPGGTMHVPEVRRKRFQETFNTAVSDQSAHLKHLDRHPALVLNADYAPMSYLPLSMWHWQEAVKAIFSGKCTVVDVYPDVTIRAANLEIPLPAVIALTEYVPSFTQRPAFTKRNVFLRDEYRCQYCLHHFHTRDLSIDHVVPRCKGGHLHWENAVTSCRKCNGRKGSLAVKDLRQVNMKLAREPRVPTQFQLAAIAGRMMPARVHASWEPYLGLAAGPKTTSTSASGSSNEAEQ
jgi:5-methylcytosine-specific restriction endonuclease McrA